jgi:hypothetical protein
MSLFRRALPCWVLLVLAVSGSAAHAGLFVSGFLNNAVLEYNGTTGAFVKTFASGGSLSAPTFLTFSPEVSAVPEPPGLLLAALGALTALASAARRRAAAIFRPAKP